MIQQSDVVETRDGTLHQTLALLAVTLFAAWLNSCDGDIKTSQKRFVVARVKVK